jgi:hypothetical protein
MGFLVAQLGSSDNKKAFIQDQKDFYPDFSGWHISADKQKEILAKNHDR